VSGGVVFHDLHPVLASLREAVIRGLGSTPKAIPPMFFYDEQGSHLFDAICEQPEYYLPDIERRLLRELADELPAYVPAGSLLVEPGAGSAEKVRLLLPALRPAAYVPIDISGRYLRRTAAALARDHAWLPVHAVCDDFTSQLRLPPDLPDGRRLMFFPGSSLGNFDPAAAGTFLERVARLVGPYGLLLIGVDTKKPVEVLNAAYNDAQGVTAAFNLNLLTRINRELGADFDLEAFEHYAFYDPAKGCVEMHLVSQRPQEVRVQDRRFHFAEGETLHTECSYKYAPEEFQRLAETAGLVCTKWWTDDQGYFAVYLLQVPGGSAET
jgi:dimethylhistidine N-methyltransferase